MKTPVAITLVIMGTLLVMLPILADYCHQRNLVEVMNLRGFNSVTLGGSKSEEYRFGCWMTESAIVGIAVLRSLIKSSSSPTDSSEITSTSPLLG